MCLLQRVHYAVITVSYTHLEYEVNTVKDMDYSVYKMRNGDVVTAEAILNRFINKLEIRGAVYRPGIYELNGRLNTCLLYTSRCV